MEVTPREEGESWRYHYTNAAGCLVFWVKCHSVRHVCEYMSTCVPECVGAETQNVYRLDKQISHIPTNFLCLHEPETKPEEHGYEETWAG